MSTGRRLSHGIPYGLFLRTIFPRRLRTFGEGPALFTMYKSEGPISKTSEAPPVEPWGCASNAEEGRRRSRHVCTSPSHGSNGRARGEPQSMLT